MREIKFRAWDTAYNFMRYPGYSDEYISLLDGKSYEVNEHGECELPYKLMQFTGLHDKNGKEIYEGDILIAPDELPLYVEFSKEHAAFVFVDKFDRLGTTIYTPVDIAYEGFEVIGNIYENPELLKEEV